MSYLYYFAYFFIYSFLGWIIEVSFHVITKARFINRGFLNGPYCPIYGFGALSILHLIADTHADNKIKLLFYSMIIATILELITGFILEKLFNKRWWDYSDKKFNYKGYICLEFSLIWGAISFILYEAIHPLIVLSIGKIPYNILVILNIVFFIIFLSDFIATIMTLFGLNKKFKEIEKTNEAIRKLSDDIGIKVADRTFEAIDKKKKLESTEKFKEFDERNKEFKEKFKGFGEKRILRAYPNLLKGLEIKIEDIIDDIKN